ncbi:glycoside hydrolase family 97 catalytic domain-containing protein [Marinilabiliaceae bacterium ANBcel2]|nr:glycoside hydrolase family 97 catalytic domain-containing protein [Marinilabiliaceae bacterium ANBcel2]
MKSLFISFCLLFCSLMTLLSNNNLFIDKESPNGTLNLQFSVDNGGLLYKLIFKGDTVIAPSSLGFATSEGVDLHSGFTVIESNEKSNQRADVELLYGERSCFEMSYNSFTVKMEHLSGILMEIEFRVYDEGAAFRYSFPQNEGQVFLRSEYSAFNVENGLSGYRESGYESGYIKTCSSERFRTLLPFTLIGENYSLAFNEALNDHFVRANLLNYGNGQLSIQFASADVHRDMPFKTPWRYILVGDRPEDLIENKNLLYTLVDNDSIDDYKWVNPGKVFRVMNMDTQSVKEAADFAADFNFDYLLLDAGWYGMGYGIPNENDPSSDPRNVIEELDIEKVVDYASQKSMGLILYVNQVAWSTYDPHKLVSLYQSWGISGLKLGFMRALSAVDRERLFEIVSLASEAKMVVNIHDNIRLTGEEKLYSNLLTVEGIRGNEYIDNRGDHTTLLPYTRYLSGAADYTICFEGMPKDHPKLHNNLHNNGTTKAHQLALSVLFYSPLQHLLWYGIPEIYEESLSELNFFKELPVVWDDYSFIKGDPGHYFAKARRCGDEWYAGVITNSEERQLSIGLDFLDEERYYRALIYGDDGENSIFEEIIEEVTSKSVIDFNLSADGGAAIVFTPK